MNTMKKMASLLLALVLVLAMTVTAYADDTTYSITINNKLTGHTYEAYQVFAGTLSSKDGKNVLSDITWGNGVDQTKVVDGKTLSEVFEGKSAEEVADTLSTEADAKAFAQKVAPYLTNPTESAAQSDNQYVISGLTSGYYLVKDKDNTLDEADDFYTAYMMKVVSDVTATPKGDKPELKKEIKHNEKGTWEVVGDNQIGDTVEFRTITTLPDTTNYTEYDYTIHDTMSDGLTSNVKTVADVTVKVNDETVLDASYITVTVDSTNANSFSVKIDVLKAIADGVMKSGDKLYTYYTGVLNENAKVYDEGNQVNEAYLEYSNNPNDNTGKGKTEESKVYDWTFKMGVNKVGEDKKTTLTGAKFALSEDGTLKVADMKCGEDGEPTVTDSLIGMVKVKDGEYRLATDKDAADTIVYTVEAGNPVIKGLDDNTDYYLYETKAPEGYNTLTAPVQFIITAEYTTDGSKVLEGYPTVKVGTSDASTSMSIDVINTEGSHLPETGGIGTTIFYALGSLLVLGAGIVLITRKRMNNAEN